MTSGDGSRGQGGGFRTRSAWIAVHEFVRKTETHEGTGDDFAGANMGQALLPDGPVDEIEIEARLRVLPLIGERAEGIGDRIPNEDTISIGRTKGDAGEVGVPGHREVAVRWGG